MLPLTAALAAAWGYQVLRQGGAASQDWLFCVLMLGGLTLFYLGSPYSPAGTPALERKFGLPLLLLVGLAVLQVIPIPEWALEMLSPARASLNRSLLPIGISSAWAPLSVTPAETLFRLSVVLGCIATMLLVRELTWKLGRRAWVAAVPIIVIPALEGALGLVQGVAAPSRWGVSGTYVNHNHFAGLLELSLPFAVIGALLAARQIRAAGTHSAQSTLTACAAIAAAGLIFLGLILSFSRAGFAAAVLSLVAVSALASTRDAGRRRTAVVYGVLAPAAVSAFLFLLPDGFIARYAGVVSPEGLLTEGRVELWRETLDLVAAYPLVGCGLGTYQSAFWRHKQSWPHVTDDHAHNDYLEMLAELGVVGFLPAMWFVAAVFAQVARICRDSPYPKVRLLALACLGSILALAVHSVSDFNLSIPANAMLFAWILGIALGLTALARKPSSEQQFPGVIEFERRNSQKPAE